MYVLIYNACYNATSLHCRRSDKSWTKGEGGEGKERLLQDPVLLKSAPHINGCTCQITANQNLPEGRMLSCQLIKIVTFFPNGWKEIPSKLLLNLCHFRIQFGEKQRYISLPLEKVAKV